MKLRSKTAAFAIGIAAVGALGVAIPASAQAAPPAHVGGTTLYATPDYATPSFEKPSEDQFPAGKDISFECSANPTGHQAFYKITKRTAYLPSQAVKLDAGTLSACG
ncbi:hypothetical protein R3Q06_30840 [Rhodococcus erythropolis]|uniref:hypothetical protein n=1 Tax=Rhodococcus erythropolis TaxID=1833 RepID=UPI00294A12FC|nr:hypothetical protein [Rhodococcus erythropolis]MDV6277890.1 hypothetical protein [Rhodococcus erythropolis]